MRRSQQLQLPQREFRFTRKAVRDALHWGDTQLKLHLSRLAGNSNMLPSTGAVAPSSYEFLARRQQAAGKHVCGLIDAATPWHKTAGDHDDGKRSGAR